MLAAFIFFFLRALICLALYGLLVVAGRGKSKLWRMSAYGGMVLNGISAYGYLLPTFIPNADVIGLVANTLMIGGVFFSYYQAVPASGFAVRRTLARELGALVGLSAVLATFVAFSADKRSEMKVQQSLTDVVSALSDEVRQMHQNQDKMDRKLSEIERRTAGLNAPRR